MDILTKVNITGAVAPIKTGPVNKARGPEKNSANKYKSSTPHETSETSAPSQAFSVTALDSILFNDSSNNKNHRQKLIKHGEDLLDQLEQIRINLISGTLEKRDLLSIRDTLAQKPDLGDDMKLREILLEIETRAAVELAKLGII